MWNNNPESCGATADLNAYEAPAIIFESIISTRAGSPIIESDAPQPPAQDNSIDLFPTD
ncbi:MAG: hypothetical protein AB8G95_09440 [Anaerolineae bacterium]